MPAIPLPFVVSLLLVLLLARLVAQREPTLRPAVVFVGACAALTVIVGLRWSFDARVLRFLQPIVASTLPPIAWACFSELSGAGRAGRRWVHALPVGVVAALSASWPLWQPPIDLVLAAVFFGYGFALLRIGSAGADGLPAARLSDTPRAQRATLVAGAMLVGSGAVDVLVAGDFGLYQGAHAATIVGLTNLLALPLIAYAVVIAGRSVAAPEVLAPLPDGAAEAAPPDPPPETRTSDDAEIVAAVDALMRTKRLYRDPDLSLDRLARRAGIPARQISTAINRVFGRNVSQVLNEYRIEEAKRLLASSDLPVTAILFDVGFQTKSNFNREFLRVTGMTPSDYRRSSARPSADGPSAAEAPSPETR